jgi:hypothetical protein
VFPAQFGFPGRGGTLVGVLRELRGRNGEPHVGTRLVALVLALLLAFPLTIFLWRLVSWALGPAF